MHLHFRSLCLLAALCLSPFISLRAQGLTGSSQFYVYQRGGGGGISAFSLNNSADVQGSQFFLSDWSAGSITMNNGETYSNGYQFVYDKVRQEIFIKQQGVELVLQASKPDIRSFQLKDGPSTYTFL